MAAELTATTLDIAPELIEDLQELAALEGRTAVEQAEHLIREAVSKHRRAKQYLADIGFT